MPVAQRTPQLFLLAVLVWNEFGRQVVLGLAVRTPDTVVPLWRKDPKVFMNEMIDIMDIMVVSVSAEGLRKEWLGRKLDAEAIEELKILNEKHGVHIAFEGGEAETIVLNCPIYERPLEIEMKELVWEGNSGVLVVN